MYNDNPGALHLRDMNIAVRGDPQDATVLVSSSVI
jgi:hypothetical protein